MFLFLLQSLCVLCRVGSYARLVLGAGESLMHLPQKFAPLLAKYAELPAANLDCFNHRTRCRDKSAIVSARASIQLSPWCCKISGAASMRRFLTSRESRIWMKRSVHFKLPRAVDAEFLTDCDNRLSTPCSRRFALLFSRPT